MLFRFRQGLLYTHDTKEGLRSHMHNHDSPSTVLSMFTAKGGGDEAWGGGGGGGGGGGHLSCTEDCNLVLRAYIAITATLNPHNGNEAFLQPTCNSLV